MNIGPASLWVPLELVCHIASYLPDHYDCTANHPHASTADIKAARLTCKALNEAASPFLIPDLWLSIDEKDIKRLFEVANHPVLSKHVTRILYDCTFFEPLFGKGNAGLRNYLDSAGEEGDGVNGVSNYSWKTKERGWQMYRSKYAQQVNEPLPGSRSYSKLPEDSKVLIECLWKMPKVRSLVLCAHRWTSKSQRSHIQWRPGRRLATSRATTSVVTDSKGKSSLIMDPRPWPKYEEDFNAADTKRYFYRGFMVFTHAVCKGNLTHNIKSIEVHGNHIGMSYTVFNGYVQNSHLDVAPWSDKKHLQEVSAIEAPNWDDFRESTHMNKTEFRHACALFRHLTTINLQLTAWKNDWDPYNNFEAVIRAGTIGRVIATAEDLHELRLCFPWRHEFIYVDDASFVLGDRIWPKLTKLALEGMSFKPKDTVAFVAKHAESLKSLTWDCLLPQGDDEGDYETFEWQECPELLDGIWRSRVQLEEINISPVTFTVAYEGAFKSGDREEIAVFLASGGQGA